MAIEIDEFIKALLTRSHHWRPDSSLQFHTTSELHKFISHRLLSRQFRKSGLTKSLADRIHDKVSRSLNAEKPIQIVLPFGGYKNALAQPNTLVNWAEFFNIAMMCEYVAPILGNYSPGVIIDYNSGELAMGWLDNIPEAEIARYQQSFRHLLALFRAHFPSNLSINYTQDREFYEDDTGFLEKIETLAKSLKPTWFAQLPVLERENHLSKAKRNYRWKGRCDYSHLEPSQRLDILIKSVCLHEAYIRIDDQLRYEYLQGGAKIPISTRKGYEGWLHLGSCRSSIVQFWVGVGVLQKDQEKFVPRILSKAQLDRTNVELTQSEIILMENFRNIPIIDFVSR